MNKTSLLRRLFQTLLFIIFVFMAVYIYVTKIIYTNHSLKEMSDHISEKSQILIPILKSKINHISELALQEQVNHWGYQSQSRVTIINLTGKVLADSKASPINMDNHSDRPEVAEALKGKIGKSIRNSHTLNKKYLYIAHPVFNEENKIVAILRNSIPLTTLVTLGDELTKQMILISVILSLFLFFAISIHYKRLVTTINKLRKYAESFAAGEFTKKIPKDKTDTIEIDRLTESLNSMATQLSKKIKTIANQDNIQNIIFNSMNEGILTLDKENNIFYINNATLEIFNIPNNKNIKGLPFNNLSGHKKLLKMAEETSSTLKSNFLELSIDKEKTLQISCSPLYKPNLKHIGILFVFHDVSKIRRLENYRKDFVSNVSHELKTPLTSIQGYIEALLEEELERDMQNQFMQKVHKNTVRLKNLVDDLLELGEIENEGDATASFIDCHINLVLSSAISSVESLAQKKNIHIVNNNELDKNVFIHPSLMQQAISNILENAIKFSADGDSVIINTALKNNGIEIHIIDNGPGIPKEFHERIFERFFSVDKARSRDQGGSGLGLAIVKHILSMHQGEVLAKNALNKGSEFILFIPIAS